MKDYFIGIDAYKRRSKVRPPSFFIRSPSK